MPETATGRLEPWFEPLPSSPNMFLPQQRIVPFEISAHVWVLPAEMDSASVTPETATGVSEPVVFPLPSWPLAFAPQHATVPSERRAQVCCPPEEIRVAVETPATATGKSLFAPVPSPSCPLELSPQHSTVPSTRAQVWKSPAETCAARRAAERGPSLPSTPPLPQPQRAMTSIENNGNSLAIMVRFFLSSPGGEEENPNSRGKTRRYAATTVRKAKREKMAKESSP